MYIGIHGSYRLLFLMYVTFIHADMQQYILWESLNFYGIRWEIFPDTRWKITNFRAYTVTLFVTIVSYLSFNYEMVISFVHFLITNNWSICVKSILIIRRHFFFTKEVMNKGITSGLKIIINIDCEHGYEALNSAIFMYLHILVQYTYFILRFRSFAATTASDGKIFVLNK